ncbi:NAD-dependent protein deacylase [Shimia sp. SK013]|uniref:NAD-dependent deacylase n=1 Tax=Shimia sp. SK013 TaxID=1389006 RepID=UPI0006B57C28|nr:NAD-dependent deacylase [Shimia sp. SK013]KPA21118.1 NAD-dependent protein deacylase [Shimia sp. SK013]
MTAKIVILTGAGISAESGLGTFRDVDGLWTKYDLNDVATPEGFARNPELVMAFYNARRANAAEATPNAAHKALARLEADFPGEVFIVTQNVDGLHEAAGSRNVLHMHGALHGALCKACEHRWPAPPVMSVTDPCPHCRKPATRPDVVWFGEIPYGMHVISEALSQADVFVSIGTSGEVYPAANFVAEADHHGAHTIELNLEPSAGASGFAETRFGPATEVVPQWVADELARTQK